MTPGSKRPLHAISSPEVSENDVRKEIADDAKKENPDQMKATARHVFEFRTQLNNAFNASDLDGIGSVTRANMIKNIIVKSKNMARPLEVTTAKGVDALNYFLFQIINDIPDATLTTNASSLQIRDFSDSCYRLSFVSTLIGTPIFRMADDVRREWAMLTNRGEEFWEVLCPADGDVPLSQEKIDSAKTLEKNARKKGKNLQIEVKVRESFFINKRSLKIAILHFDMSLIDIKPLASTYGSAYSNSAPMMNEMESMPQLHLK